MMYERGRMSQSDELLNHLNSVLDAASGFFRYAETVEDIEKMEVLLVKEVCCLSSQTISELTEKRLS